jgi:GNAT superfamily N-acetyltransferase
VAEYWCFERIAGFDTDAVGTQLTSLLSDGWLGAGWLGLRDEVPVGYLLAVFVFSLEHGGLTAEIDEFYVRPQARGSGIGRAMLAAAEAAFVARGCTNVALQLGRGNDAGRAFYLHHGYAPRDGYELLDKALPTGHARG